MEDIKELSRAVVSYKKPKGGKIYRRKFLEFVSSSQYTHIFNKFRIENKNDETDAVLEFLYNFKEIWNKYRDAKTEVTIVSVEVFDISQYELIQELFKYSPYEFHLNENEINCFVKTILKPFVCVKQDEINIKLNKVANKTHKILVQIPNLAFPELTLLCEKSHPSQDTYYVCDLKTENLLNDKDKNSLFFK